MADVVKVRVKVCPSGGGSCSNQYWLVDDVLAQSPAWQQLTSGNTDSSGDPTVAPINSILPPLTVADAVTILSVFAVALAGVMGFRVLARLINRS